MKTSIKTLTTICTVIISLSMTAQPRSHNGNQPQQQNTTNQNDKQVLASNNRHGGGNRGSHISVNIGGYPSYYGNNYGYGYGYNSNYYSIKKAARNSIRQSANVIGQALNFSDWNDIYSPWLAKAVQHQQYAKQLYFWGDYAGALNHAERAGFLAWNTLSYFNNSYGYNDMNNYPNPYSDPNNPYYRQNNTQPNTNNNSSSEEYGYRKGSTEPSQNNSENAKRDVQPEQKLNKTELDNSLPQSKMSDKELLKINARDLDIE
ncbi:MAG: hypothetical protein HY062_13250 [Bacteroidetes bacterium]|nr:hypothetical protein [Bacteroidota bacterium]